MKYSEGSLTITLRADGTLLVESSLSYTGIYSIGYIVEKFIKDYAVIDYLTLKDQDENEIYLSIKENFTGFFNKYPELLI